MILKSMFKSKKGVIIVSDILDTIRSLISWFFATMPKPVLFMMFLFFIIFMAGIIIPLMANTFGYHCDSNGVVWKVDSLTTTNFDIMFNRPALDGVYIDFPMGCFPEDFVDCTNCSYNQSETYSLFSNYYCISDGYRLDSYTSLGEKIRCNAWGCAPPEDFFYNWTEDKYQCNNANCLNLSINEYNDKIYHAEGNTPAYINIENEYSGNRAVYFKCKKDNPVSIRLTFFGLDIFDYRIWLLMMLLGAMVWFYINISNK